MESNKQKISNAEPELDWIQLRKDIGSPETTKEKLKRKFKENPFVPIGCLLTAGALFYGLWSFRQGHRQMSQYMMRFRVVAQGLTVAALVGGMSYSAYVKSKSNQKE